MAAATLGLTLIRLPPRRRRDMELDTLPAQSPGRLVRKTTVELVVDALRARILSGQLAPGQPLRQEALAEDLGVSRIPVREAIRLLSAEGLADLVPHKGAYVSTLSPGEVQELFDLRLRIEPWLIHEAAPVISEAALVQAEAMVGAMDAAQDADWGQLNRDFHEFLYRPAGRATAMNIVRSLHEKSERYFRLQVFNAPIKQQAREEHLALIELCRARQADAAQALLTRHIEDAALQIRGIIDRLMKDG